MFTQPCEREKTVKKVSIHTSFILPFSSHHLSRRLRSNLLFDCRRWHGAACCNSDCCMMGVEPTTSVCFHQAQGSLCCEKSICSLSGPCCWCWMYRGLWRACGYRTQHNVITVYEGLSSTTCLENMTSCLAKLLLALKILSSLVILWNWICIS